MSVYKCVCVIFFFIFYTIHQSVNYSYIFRIYFKYIWELFYMFNTLTLLKKGNRK